MNGITKVSITLTTTVKEVHGKDATSYAVDNIDEVFKEYASYYNLYPHNTVDNGVVEIKVNAKVLTDNHDEMTVSLLGAVWGLHPNFSVVKFMVNGRCSG